MGTAGGRGDLRMAGWAGREVGGCVRREVRKRERQHISWLSGGAHLQLEVPLTGAPHQVLSVQLTAPFLSFWTW